MTSASGTYKYKTGVDFEQGYYECGKKVTSSNAGDSCTTSSDCPSTETSVLAECACSYGSSKSICGILTGNREWQDYFSTTVEYYENTKDCHNAQSFNGVCNKGSLQDERQCKKAQAKNYIEYLNSPDWAKYYSNRYLFPEVNEIEEWCNPDRKGYLLGINASMNNQIAIVAMAVLMILYSI